jgi:hypothetical protein
VGDVVIANGRLVTFQELAGIRAPMDGCTQVVK